MVFALAIVLSTGVMSFVAPANTVSAECDPTDATKKCCAGVEVTIFACEQTGGEGIKNSGVWGILLVAINILTALVALAAVAGVIYGSILYTSAGGNQEQTKKAMGVITNVVIGVIAYAAMYSVSNFLIPGGIFSA